MSEKQSQYAAVSSTSAEFDGSLTENVEKSIEEHLRSIGSSGQDVNEIRRYLDRTVSPILLHGLAVLTSDRPGDPIQFLSEFLIRNKEKYSSAPSTVQTVYPTPSSD